MVGRFRRRITGILLVLYVAFVCVITLSPRMPGASTTNRLVRRVLAELHERGILTWVTFLHVEFVANILMFVPLGLLTALALHRRWWWTLLFLGTAFSAVIELCQLLLLPGRYSEVRDIVSNSIGFLIGAGVAVLLRLLIAHRDRLVIAEARAAR